MAQVWKKIECGTIPFKTSLRPSGDSADLSQLDTQNPQYVRHKCHDPCWLGFVSGPGHSAWSTGTSTPAGDCQEQRKNLVVLFCTVPRIVIVNLFPPRPAPPALLRSTNVANSREITNRRSESRNKCYTSDEDDVSLSINYYPGGEKNSRLIHCSNKGNLKIDQRIITHHTKTKREDTVVVSPARVKFSSLCCHIGQF